MFGIDREHLKLALFLFVLSECTDVGLDVINFRTGRRRKILEIVLNRKNYRTGKESDCEFHMMLKEHKND
jgi:hypothetical protein